jgi:hypothetical protein
LKNIVDALGAFSSSQSSHGSVPARTAQPENGILESLNSDDGDQIVQWARDTGDQKVISGTLELVGLDDVRMALGPAWEVIAAQVMDTAAQEVRYQLGKGDFFRSRGQSAFLICFAHASKTVAEERARHIAGRIRHRLSLEFPDLIQDVSPESFVAEIDLALLDRSIEPLAERLFKHLNHLRRSMEYATSRFRSPLLRNSRLLYAPAWHSTRNATAFNRCILDTGIGGTRIDDLRYSLGDNQYLKAVAEFDFLTLTRSLRALYMMLKAGRAVPLLVPVNYQTISNSTTGPQYSKLIATMREPHKKLIALEIRQVPSSITAPKAFEAIGTLGNDVNWLAVELDLADDRKVEFAQPPMWALAVDLKGERSTDALLLSRLRATQTIASAAGLNTLAHGANSIGLALAAADAGMTYIDGPAIHPVGQTPKSPGPLKPALTPISTSRIIRRWRS